MPSFLDLPREIRDEIYIYCLVSPSGLIAPYLLPRTGTLNPRRRSAKPPKGNPKPKQNQKYNQKQQLRLITTPLTLPPDSPIFQTPDLFLAHQKSAYITLSLPSTCRQIYAETRRLFWRRSTFYFVGFCESGRSLGVARTLKVMGQTASRMIERVTIRMPGLRSRSEYNTGAWKKVLNTLSSRARLGRFKRLELVWGEEDFWGLVHARYIDDGTVLFDNLLRDLTVGLEGGRFERVVRVPPFPPFPPSVPATLKDSSIDVGHVDDELKQDYENVLGCLHMSIGGKMVAGDVV